MQLFLQYGSSRVAALGMECSSGFRNLVAISSSALNGISLLAERQSDCAALRATSRTSSVIA